jgi:hypothetical protein
MRGDIGGVGLHLVVVLQLDLLEQQVRASTHEGVWRRLGFDHRLDVAKLPIEAAKEIQDLA